MRRLSFCLAVTSAAMLAAGSALATERNFTYTYESGVLAPGQTELEPWVTFRVGREQYFHRYDIRTEFEGGIVPKLQTSLYLNFSSTALDTADPVTGESFRTQSFAFQGVSNEWKYQLSDPLADPIGSALYVEGTFAPQRTELEAKVILDKSFGRAIAAFNLVGEYEWEWASRDTTYTYVLIEADLAGAYALSEVISAGVELNAPFRFYGTAPPGAEDNGVLYAGPVLSARFERWWLTTTFLTQLVALKNPTSGALNLAEHERFQVRTVWGFHL